MEDFNLDLVIDSGPGARSVQVKLNPFTLIGATTKAGLLSAPMRSRFGFCGRKLLSILINHYSGGPVGLSTLAMALGEEARTVEEVYEPYLIMQGYIKRTPRGREATNLAYQLIQKNPQGG